MDNLHPLFSIIILCWNNNQTITSCLDALSAQTLLDFEIVLVDNGSTEPISKALISNYSNLPIQFYKFEHNTGFAYGNNFAASKAKADYLVLLNADAFPRSDWLENINKGMTKYPNSFFASKLVMANHLDRLDGTGDVYHISGLAWRKSYNRQISSFPDQEREVFSPCGAAAVYPTHAYHQVNGFDEDYFAYEEDVDLGFRLRLAGYQCMYLPNAVVYHVGSGSTHLRSNLSVYYGQRNLVWTYIKNMPGIFVWVLAPLHLMINLLLIALGIFRRQGMITLKAKRDAVLKFPAMLRKRKQVQITRSVSISKLLLVMDCNPLAPIIKNIHN